ncbi:hypothetical protein Mgra_00007669 [Meloidogyne graminicola]|uniref:Uncharacterized protein n=1 Tax=Meloidogyne graminicola TaxID=189291 RepID=A0A8S9ZI38_9BILA|nr:hypothetical protein Mgra_00007669 [Meloidogyne graminicola]
MDNNNTFPLNLKIIPTSICLSLLTIFLIPLLFFFTIILYNTKRLHINTRILLTVVPFIFYTSYFANFFLNTLPILILIEKLFSTIFCKFYETKKSLRWISICILAIDIFVALLLSIIRCSQTISNKEENIITHHIELVLFQVSATLPCIFLLFWNVKLLSPQFASNPCFSKSISCRYQLRENCRTLRFCLFFVLLLSASTFIHILFHVILNDESFSFNINYSIQNYGPFEEILNIFPSYIALVGTLFGHKSLKQSLLTRFGFNISERCNAKKMKQLHINTVDDGFLSSFSSNRTARVSDAKSVNELIRDAHFDILQNCWDRKPER